MSLARAYETGLDPLIKQWNKTPLWAKTLFSLAPLTAGYLLRGVIDHYHGWLRMGKGGAPYNFAGYLITFAFESVFGTKDTKSLEIYQRPEKYIKGWNQASEEEKANAQKSFFREPLPRRVGPEAKALPFNIPQREREVGSYTDPDLREAYKSATDSLAESHSPSIEWKTSTLEKRGRAMFLAPSISIPTPITPCRGEVCHVHESDLSGHVALSLADAKEVIEKGWGERHRMSGSRIIPLGYTMVYSPRKMEEVQVLRGIFEAGVAYAMSNGEKAG